MRNRLIQVGCLLAVVIFLIVLCVYRNNSPSGIDTPATVVNTQFMSQNIPAAESTTDTVMRKWFTPLIPLTLGDVVLGASVADTPNERAAGLSGSPYLPETVVKLFVFDYSFAWGFWMQDMNYPIDIIWLDEEKRVVHVLSDAAPDSFPTSFKPPVPAKYVIETVAGFAALHNIEVGTEATWGQ